MCRTKYNTDRDHRVELIINSKCVFPPPIPSTGTCWLVWPPARSSCSTLTSIAGTTSTSSATRTHPDERPPPSPPAQFHLTYTTQIQAKQRKLNRTILMLHLLKTIHTHTHRHTHPDVTSQQQHM